MLPAASGRSPSDTEDDQSCLRCDRGVPRTARNAALLGAVRWRLLSAGGCPLFPRTPVLLRTLSPSSLLPPLLSLSPSLFPSLSLLDSPVPLGPPSRYCTQRFNRPITIMPSCNKGTTAARRANQKVRNQFILPSSLLLISPSLFSPSSFHFFRKLLRSWQELPCIPAYVSSLEFASIDR